MVVLNEPREKQDGEEFEHLRRLEQDQVQIQPTLATIGGDPYEFDRGKHRQADEDQQGRRSNDATQSKTRHHVQREQAEAEVHQVAQDDAEGRTAVRDRLALARRGDRNCAKDHEQRRHHEQQTAVEVAARQRLEHSLGRTSSRHLDHLRDLQEVAVEDPKSQHCEEAREDPEPDDYRHLRPST